MRNHTLVNMRMASGCMELVYFCEAHMRVSFIASAALIGGTSMAPLDILRPLRPGVTIICEEFIGECYG